MALMGAEKGTFGVILLAVPGVRASGTVGVVQLTASAHHAAGRAQSRLISWQCPMNVGLA